MVSLSRTNIGGTQNYLYLPERVQSLTTRSSRGALSKQERLDYTKAVNCLLSKPANYPASLVPGGRSRFDDFVAVHINQTLTIHSTGNFLSWHRYFTWLYEKALQDEC